MAIGGILFDKDGTLLDFNATWVPVIREAALAVAGGDANLAARLMAAGGQDDSQGTVAPGSLLAAGTTKEIAALWADLAPDHGQRDLIGFIDSLFIEGGKATAVAVPGMANVLARLKHGGIRLGLATSDSEAGAVATLAGFGVVGLFDFLAGYDSGYGVKPEPGMVEGFREACLMIFIGFRGKREPLPATPFMAGSGGGRIERSWAAIGAVP